MTIFEIDGDRVKFFAGALSYPANVARWKIVARGPATDIPKLWRDMTPEEKGALLLAHHEGKVVQSYNDHLFRWFENDRPIWLDDVAYRIRPEPKRETVTLQGYSHDKFGWTFGSQDFDPGLDTHRITFDVIDGEPDCASVKMERIE